MELFQNNTHNSTRGGVLSETYSTNRNYYFRPNTSVERLTYKTSQLIVCLLYRIFVYLFVIWSFWSCLKIDWNVCQKKLMVGPLWLIYIFLIITYRHYLTHYVSAARLNSEMALNFRFPLKIVKWRSILVSRLKLWDGAQLSFPA